MATFSYLSLIIILSLVFIIASTNATECIDKSGYGRSGDANNNFTVRMRTHCVNASITIWITYDGYDRNWFGIVFADSMIGNGAANALVYTTGKRGHFQRDLNLYSYVLTSRARNASGVAYNGDDALTQLSIQTLNTSIGLMYSWAVNNVTFLHHNRIPFMWARGNASNDHRLSYHKGDGTATEPVIISLSAVAHTPPTFLQCGHVDMYPLHVCTQIMANGNLTSQRYTCSDAVYIQSIYDDGACMGNITQNISHPCDTDEEGACICGSECEYALTKEYAETQCARYYDTPLNVCIRHRNGRYSSQIACENGTYQQTTYEHGACKGSALQTETLECDEGTDCICSSDVMECPYAIFKQVISANDTNCPGLEWKEEALVLNECVRRNATAPDMRYQCDMFFDILRVDACDGDTHSAGIVMPCDLQCVQSNATQYGECSGDNWIERAYVLNECMAGLDVQISCPQDEDDGLRIQACNDSANISAIRVCDRMCFEAEITTTASITTIEPSPSPVYTVTDVITSSTVSDRSTDTAEGESITPTPAPTATTVKDETWFIVSITFIILFCVTAFVLLYWLYLYCVADDKETKGGYHKTETQETEAGGVHQTTVRQDSF